MLPCIPSQPRFGSITIARYSMKTVGFRRSLTRAPSRTPGRLAILISHWNAFCSCIPQFGLVYGLFPATMEGTLSQLREDARIHHDLPDRILPSQMSDTELNDLFAACLPGLKKAAREMLRNHQDSEDALQDGLLLAFRNLHQFQGRAAFSTWLHSIVRNSSRMHYRKAKHHIASVELAPNQDAVLTERRCVEPRPSPEEVCIQNERSEILRKVAKELPAKYHGAIKCFHLEGLGEEETARRLHITPGALKAQLHRSRRLLTSRMRSSYAPESLKIWAFFREFPRRGTAGGKCRGGRTSASRKVETMML